MRFGIVFAATAVLALFAAMGPEASAQAKALKFNKEWKGSVDNQLLIDRVPEVITSAKQLEELWKSWDIAEKAPEVDFTKEIIVVGATTGRRLNLSAQFDDKGNLTVIEVGTTDVDQGFRYVMGSVNREGVKTVNKKELPK